MAKKNSGYNNNINSNDSDDNEKGFPFGKKERKEIEEFSRKLLKLCTPIQDFLDSHFEDDVVLQVTPYSIDLLIRGMTMYLPEAEDVHIPENGTAWDLDVDGGYFDDHTLPKESSFTPKRPNSSEVYNTFKFKSKSKKNKKRKNK